MTERSSAGRRAGRGGRRGFAAGCIWLALALGAQLFALLPGDQLRIVVAEQPSLQSEYKVSGAGNIDFPLPLVGRVPVRGLSPGEVAALLKERLEEHYFYTATVTVEVMEHQEGQVFVMGEVTRPGPIPLAEGESVSVTEAIAMCGGFTPRAASNEVRVLRYVSGEGEASRQEVRVPVDDILSRFALDQDEFLVPRDLVIVPAVGQSATGGGEILVLGAVRQPRYLPLSQDLDIIKALMWAGGWSELARLDRIRILREATPEEYEKWKAENPEAAEQGIGLGAGEAELEQLQTQAEPVRWDSPFAVPLPAAAGAESPAAAGSPAEVAPGAGAPAPESAAPPVGAGAGEALEPAPGAGAAEGGAGGSGSGGAEAAAPAGAEAPVDPAASVEPQYEVDAAGNLVVDGETLVRALPVRRPKISIQVDVNSLLAGDLTQDIPLRNRDIIYVPGGQGEVTSGMVYVLGPGVMRAGPQQIPLGMKYTAGLAVTQAGIGRFANLGRAVLKRIDPQTGEMAEQRLNLDRVLNKGDVQSDIPVQDGDVIFVPDKWLSL